MVRFIALPALLRNFLCMFSRHSSSSRFIGFTLVEVIISVFIIGTMAALVMSINSNFLTNINLDTKSDELIGMLRLSQSRAISGNGNSDWGVHLANPVGSTHSFTLFKGSTYASRDVPSDIVTSLPAAYIFSTISLSGSSTDVIFQRGSGKTSQDGYIEITGSNEAIKRVTINSRGVIKKT